MKRKYGGNVKPAKVKDAAKGCKIHLVLAPSFNSGNAFADKMGWQEDRVAVITEPSHLRGVMLKPGEDVYALMKLSSEFIDTLHDCSTSLSRGEGFNLRVIT